MAGVFSYPKEEYLLLGKVTKAHGLRGEVKILSFSGQPGNFHGYRELVLVSSDGTLSPALTLERVRAQGKTAIVKFGSLNERQEAEAVEGMGVLLKKELLPDLTDDEYYWYQFKGKKVIDITGQTVGRVANLFNNGAQDILVVRSNDNEILIPVTKSIFVQETADALIIDPPPGLLELGNDQSDER